jgi:hypothetical protein
LMPLAKVVVEPAGSKEGMVPSRARTKP